MSKTPLIDALNALNHDRYHMPGHKGIKPEGFPDVFAIDLTEINQTGNLFLADGPIYDSEKLAAGYFGATECVYLTGGSTQGIMTAIFSVHAKKMIIDRNSHKSVANALGLMDIEPIFVYPDINKEFSVPDKINPLDIEQLIIENLDIDAVLITSPNYYGICSDTEAIAKICKKYDKILIVDEAHGCHFEAISVKNAIKSGANIAITSAHKTTDSLGQGALLLSDEKVPNLRKNASIFGTTSPSYAIMASIEMAISKIFDYQNILKNVAKLKKDLVKNTKFQVLFCEDLTRLVINTKEINKTGFEISEILENEYGIVAEMADLYNVVFIITPRDLKLDYLLQSLCEISENCKYCDMKSDDISYIKSERKISVREALFCNGREILLKDAANFVSKDIIAPYPPGVPIIYPGEIILPLHIEYLTKICYNTNIKIYITDK